MPVDHKEKAFESAIELHLIASAGYAKAGTLSGAVR